ncbi:MAG: hypothetical protein LBS58_02640 [Coriobacteriales bacterium]|nr:hypothetical protein [Coriobacteriales bacterium]
MAPETLGTLFEAFMIVSFGIAWPMTVLKSLRSKTAKGKSVTFSVFIWLGYAFGIGTHIVVDNINYVLVFYAINMIMVTTDFCLYFRNKGYDRLAAAQLEAELTEARKGGDAK